jgi:type I phosphodiesterase/nucleotide pyrophosphatase
MRDYLHAGAIPERKRRSERPVVVHRSAAWKIRHRPRLFAAILAIYLALSTMAAGITSYRLHNRSDPPPLAAIVRVPDPITPAKYLVLMVLDGARPDYFGRIRLPHVDALRARGAQFSNAMDGILESETPAGHATLATGTSPAHNGILGFDWTRGGRGYSIFDPEIIRAGAVERIFETEHVPTIATLYKRKYFGSLVVALSGHKYYAADPLGGPDADAIMYYQGSSDGRYVPVSIPGHSPPAGVLTAPGVIGPSTHMGLTHEDNLATNLALAAFHRMHQRITLINYPEFDWPLGHVDGGTASPTRLARLMRGFDRDLGRIETAYRKAGILKQTLFVITADHGMGPVTRFIPDTVITSAAAQAGTGITTATYSTGAYIWPADPSLARSVAENIVAEKDPGVESVYYRDPRNLGGGYELAGGVHMSRQEDAAHRYLLQTLLDGHEPGVVAFARYGQTFMSSTTNWRGDHGGAGWSSQHIPLILAGPGIRQSTIADPAQLEDVAPTVLADMGVAPTGMEGRVLTDALLHPSIAATSARRAEVTQITPIVKALIQQERAER